LKLQTTCGAKALWTPQGTRRSRCVILAARPTFVGQPISGDEIRSLRERAHLSQAVFARYLNLTTGYVSQLERGAKRSTGPALVLLNVTRRKGIEAIL